MNKLLTVLLLAIAFASCNPKLSNGLRLHDLNKDVQMITDKGTLIIRLSDSTPLHRDNFLRLVKNRFYDSILFHRVINQFMVQAGDPTSKRAADDQPLGSSDPSYTVPAEIRSTLFHKKGVIAAARIGDDVNPLKASSSSQFYLVQGKVFTDAGLDSVETMRLRGRKLPAAHREVYKTLGGTPHLDLNYTVFGEVISGIPVIDSIAATPTNKEQGDRPITNVKIIKARLIKRN